MKCNKDKECVELNIYVDCCDNTGSAPKPEPKPEPKDICGCCTDKKPEPDDEGCLKINVYVDCGKEKYTYKF